MGLRSDGMEGDTEVSSNSQTKGNRRLYRANDSLPLSALLLFGMQQIMVCVSGLLTVPLIISNELCPGRDLYNLRVKLISSTFVVSGISTLIQTGLGMRLALLQGTAFVYVPSIQAFMQLSEYKCNASETDVVPPEVYEGKLSIILGCLMATALIPIVIGMTGLVGMISKYIGPITVSPLIILFAISAVDMCVERIAKHWVSIVQAATLFIVILYLAEWRAPLPGFKNGKFIVIRENIFGQYPYLFAILVSWGFCLFLTLTDLTPPDSAARLDKNETLAVIKHADWFRLPFPGQFGVPKFHTGLFFAFVVSAMTSVFESVGDYHAAARVSEERAPASHAINRGIVAEGLGTLLAGVLGTGVGMTTHTENIGVIGITKVASRATMMTSGVLLIALGSFTKLGAVLSTIPDPLVGGVLASSISMVAGIAIANLQQVDLKLSRNVAVIGFSIVVGMIIPKYFAKYPVHTGIETLDQILLVLFTLPMFVGALIACILDNTVQGATREQRGLRKRGVAHDFGESGVDVYALPPVFMKLIENFPILTFFPFIPKDKKGGVCHAV